MSIFYNNSGSVLRKIFRGFIEPLKFNEKWRQSIPQGRKPTAFLTVGHLGSTAPEDCTLGPLLGSSEGLPSLLCSCNFNHNTGFKLKLLGKKSQHQRIKLVTSENTQKECVAGALLSNFKCGLNLWEATFTQTQIQIGLFKQNSVTLLHTCQR